MAAYKVDVTDPAKQDMLDIAAYISAELETPLTALQMLDALDAGMQSLRENPKRQALVRDERLAARGFRSLPVKNYLVFYKVRNKTHMVDVHRILYGRRDWASLL
jgi:addiction module RelE/StbE family toxin